MNHHVGMRYNIMNGHAGIRYNITNECVGIKFYVRPANSACSVGTKFIKKTNSYNVTS